MRCSCGAVYTTEEWDALPRQGIVDVERDHPATASERTLASLDLRMCPACGSTISGSSVSSKSRIVVALDSSPAPRALVVEDDSAVARAMARVLQTIGFAVTASADGAHALQRVQAGERFDLVVSDVKMPLMDGIAFRAAALVLWPELASSFVFVTGADVDPAMLAAPAFRKPVGVDFYSHVRGVLERSRP